MSFLITDLAKAKAKLGPDRGCTYLNGVQDRLLSNNSTSFKRILG